MLCFKLFINSENLKLDISKRFKSYPLIEKLTPDKSVLFLLMLLYILYSCLVTYHWVLENCLLGMLLNGVFYIRASAVY